MIADTGDRFIMHCNRTGIASAHKHSHSLCYTCRGEWKGLRKEGLGVYKYPSGAAYEGEWRGNVKDGRGLYLYPKGGTYEGEFVNGAMNGIGVRTLSTGEIKAGRWKDGKLQASDCFGGRAWRRGALSACKLQGHCS